MAASIHIDELDPDRDIPINPLYASLTRNVRP